MFFTTPDKMFQLHETLMKTARYMELFNPFSKFCRIIPEKYLFSWFDNFAHPIGVYNLAIFTFWPQGDLQLNDQKPHELKFNMQQIWYINIVKRNWIDIRWKLIMDIYTILVTILARWICIYLHFIRAVSIYWFVKNKLRFCICP